MPAELLRTARLAARAGAEILERLLDQEHRIDQKGLSTLLPKPICKAKRPSLT